MIKFGIPSIGTITDTFPGEAVLTVCAIDKPNAKRKFSLSKTAASQLGVEPGLSKIGFSFEGGNFIAVIPDSIQGIANNDRLPVNKELNFMSKKAHDYICEKFRLNNQVDNHLPISSVEEKYEMKIGIFQDIPVVIESILNNEPNRDLL